MVITLILVSIPPHKNIPVVGVEVGTPLHLGRQGLPERQQRGRMGIVGLSRSTGEGLTPSPADSSHPSV